MIFGKILFSKIRICSVAAAGGFLATKQFSQSTIKAKNENVECVEVFGFSGSPDTHALLIYLKWKNINFKFNNINPLNVQSELAGLPCGELLI
jgi:hypothetical protein